MRMYWGVVSQLPRTGSLSIWAFGKLLKGTSAVLWRCPGTSPATSTTFQFWSVTGTTWTKNSMLLCPYRQSFYCPHRYCKIQWGRPSSAMPESVPKKKRQKKKAINSCWWRDNPWLRESVSQNASYCFAWRHLILPDTSEFTFTLDSGFFNWKQAIFKDAGFRLYSKSTHNVNGVDTSGHQKSIWKTLF